MNHINCSKNLHSFFLLAIIAVSFLVGCATAPIDTLNKRIAAVEITYSGMLDLATLYQKEGRLTTAEQTKLANSFDDYVKTRNTLRAAMNIKDIDLAENKLVLMSQILDSIRPLLEKAP